MDEDVYDEEDFDDMDLDDEDDDEMTMDEDEVEDEDDFADIKTDSRKRRIFETSFKVLSVSEIEDRQREMASRVSSVLGITKAAAVMLLRQFKWHEESLVERYVEDPDKIRNMAGLSVDDDSSNTENATNVIEAAPEGYMCMICCKDTSDVPDMKTFALSCGHSLCTDCYDYYLTEKIRREGEVRQLRCPGDPKCPLLVDEPAVKALVSPETYEKYREMVDKIFVEDAELLTWCPAPDCEYAIECPVRQADLNSHVPTVTCTCGNCFCFGCGLQDHMPCTCALAKKWIQKCHDDSETSNWISANTKDCPQCHSCIEKNGGCNHMTCKKCRYEFCWVCMGDWKMHGSAYYNCGRYDDKEAKMARSEQEKSRAELERYLHYYNRYANHQQSLRLDKETFQRVEKKMREMQEESGMSWIEVQFLTQAFDALRASRHTLTWSYAFAFYLQKGHITTIFEDNQQDLEMATEQLSEIFEQPSSDLVTQKVQLLDKCAYVTNRRIIMLEHAAQGLANGTWEYTVTV